ncbi:helix-turn-helix domain-containing protein [Lichenifustis flavocetrariae]|uniref:Helix-turn-helix domain-containing protein n=1 Tax=Lichenifustis flavocetrariae TaxID=2949735 RepID=A0AA41Z366_9HYPH|nr:helix-turn-helix transcriptional regulator [Lichenifustis flavocetrariae]MCW6511955.1 helix-turn-helix domain-containing protein [Lichenifustis flavocetrariae]
MDVRALVGFNLRRLRIAHELSQEGVGLMAGFEPSYVGRIERGTENVTVGTLDRLATVLQVPVSAFFTVPAEGEAKPLVLKPGRKRKTSSAAKQ